MLHIGPKHTSKLATYRGIFQDAVLDPVHTTVNPNPKVLNFLPQPPEKPFEPPQATNAEAV